MRTMLDYWPDHFWIDAICIDQSNTIERNRQVTRMGEIYNGASIVVVWLGHTENEQLLRQACDSLDPLSNDSQDVLYEDLASNEYWSRGWITQELVFANRIEFVYNSTTFHSETLLRIICDFTTEEYYISAFSKFLHLGVDRKRVLGMSLVSLLQVFFDRKCGVPRDRIFSLRALCHEKNDIKVDYGCPVFEFIHSILESCAETSCLCATMEVMESLSAELAVGDGVDLNYRTGPYVEFNIHAGPTSCLLLQALRSVYEDSDVDSSNRSVADSAHPDGFRVSIDTARLSFWNLWFFHQELPIFHLRRKCDRPDLSMSGDTRDCAQIRFGYGSLEDDSESHGTGS